MRRYFVIFVGILLVIALSSFIYLESSTDIAPGWSDAVKIQERGFEPKLAYHNGELWLAFHGFWGSKGRSIMTTHSYDGVEWSSPFPLVKESPQDCSRPNIVQWLERPDGTLWFLWSGGTKEEECPEVLYCAFPLSDTEWSSPQEIHRLDRDYFIHMAENTPDGGLVLFGERERTGYAMVKGEKVLATLGFECFVQSSDPGSQQAPAICKNIVVWSDYRQGYGNSDVFGYDPNTGKEFQITTDKDEQDDVAIYNNIAVWEDERGVNEDVLYGYNLETEEEFRVQKSYWYFILEMSQHNPAIFEDTVVWTTGLDYEIYGYNMSTSKEVKIAVAQKVPCIPGKNCIQVRPAIHSNIVVWADTRNGNSDIYGHDLDAGEELQITTNPEDQYSPAIYGNVVAWTDRRNGTSDIYCCDISTIPRSPPLAVSREVLYLFVGVVALAVIALMVRKKESKLRAQQER